MTSRTLSNGYQAAIEEDRWVPGAYTLVVDGTPQSHVDLGDPSRLFFEYVRRMGHVIDEIGMPGEPLTALHLGGGALTLPRYITATRPGSRQQVVELESDLVDFVREHLPWPKQAQIRVRHGDARAVVGKLPAGLRGTVDLIVVDVFGGARIPAHVTTVEFYEMLAGLLSPRGIVLANLADGPGLAFVRGQVSTVRAVLPHAALLAEAQVLKGRRFGNVVMLASAAELPTEWMPRLLAAGPHPAKLVEGEDLRQFAATAPIVTDATAIPSPPPTRNAFLDRT